MSVIFSSLFIGMALFDAPEPGAYVLSTAAGECRVRLDASAAPLPETNLNPADRAGLALVMPGCPGALSDAIFWRYSAEDARVRLFDASGESVFEGQADDRAWQGHTRQDLPARLTPQ